MEPAFSDSITNAGSNHTQGETPSTMERSP
jgi:hypothetical protein